MALVDLKTDLKSLKFESGLNRKPFVVKDIDQEGGRNSGLAVQGILAQKRIDDVVRMAKLVIAKPGITYAAKTALSGFIESIDMKGNYENNPKLGKELLNKAKDILTTALTNTAQVPLNGLGLHLHKGNLEFDGKDARDYVKRVYGTDGPTNAEKRTKNPAHAVDPSRGIKKSKKLTLAQDKKFGKIDYTKGVKGIVVSADAITSEPIYRKDPPGFDDQFDMIPFGFSVYDQVTPLNFRFRAFLDSFSDNFTGNWDSTQYMGRPETFKTYKGFDRQVSLSFKIAAHTREELVPLYRKLNLLVSLTAPNYEQDGVFMRGTWVRMTVGDYLQKTPCTINNVGINWQQDYPWEIKLNPDDEKDVYILPHVLDVSLTAAIDHEFIPQTGVIPFIGPTKEPDFIDSKDGKPEEVKSPSQQAFANAAKWNPPSLKAPTWDHTKFF